jgi:hypothetical protein
MEDVYFDTDSILSKSSAIQEAIDWFAKILPDLKFGEAGFHVVQHNGVIVRIKKIHERSFKP